jgi:DHA1 family tetracycline resistance protein-like MFS transporter
MGVRIVDVCPVYFANDLGFIDGITFRLDADAKWFFLFMVGISSVLMQGVFLTRYIQRVGDANAVLFGLTSSCIALSLYGVATQGWMMYVLILCNMLAFASGPALQAFFSRAVNARSQGLAMGSLSALASIMSVAATLTGTALLAQVSHFPRGSWMLGAPFLWRQQYNYLRFCWRCAI